MLFRYLSAMAQKRWSATASSAQQPPRTTTPIADLTQRSMVEIGVVPLILAQGAGSLIKTIAGRNIITAVGSLKHSGLTFYKVYLSQGEGAYLHLAVGADQHKVLECRLYQPYHEISPKWANAAEQRKGLPFGAKPDEGLDWDFWLLDDPDPNVGGMIGGPIMQGKDVDGYIQYARTWTPSHQRIQPIVVKETILDIEGHYSNLQHTLMHYGRPLSDPKLNESLLVSAVESPEGASVNMWIGMDVEISDLSIYPSGH